MKKLFTLVMLAGFALASCNGGGESTTETETVTDTVTVVEETQVEIQRDVEVDTAETEVIDTLNVVE